MFSLSVLAKAYDTSCGTYIVAAIDSIGNLVEARKLAYEEVTGITCEKTCIEDIARCRQNCYVESDGTTFCDVGHLPGACDECCEGTTKNDTRARGDTYELVPDTICDASCIQDISRCNQNCIVFNTGRISCDSGHLPAICDQCCIPVSTGGGLVKSTTEQICEQVFNDLFENAFLDYMDEYFDEYMVNNGCKCSF